MTGNRVAIVGCGSKKWDVDVEVPIYRLYTSAYFEKKRSYAETCCDRWYVLSAKYGLVGPRYPAEPYDLSVDDLDGKELDQWVGDVDIELSREIDARDTVVFLAGQRYFEPLADVLEEYVWDLERPFQETSGIGEQMAWLADQLVDRDDDVDGAGQVDLARWSA